MLSVCVKTIYGLLYIMFSVLHKAVIMIMFKCYRTITLIISVYL